MNFNTPSIEELKRISSEIGLDFNDEDTHFFHELMQPFAEGYNRLADMEKCATQSRESTRTYRLPEETENKYGAWCVKTAIKEQDQGPLSGRSIAIKDNIFVKDVPMSNGAAFLEGFIPEYDAVVVTRLLDAGAEIKGKSVCEFFCLSGGSGTAHTGVVQNPHRPGYSCGGSSSGSAALVAAGEVDMALGTDQGGSVRIPSSWSGVCGMKATHGLVPYSGAAPMETSIDYIGPLTSTVRDNAVLLEVIAGNDFPPDYNPQNTGRYTDAMANSVEGMKIAVLQEGFQQPFSEPDVDECVMNAADRFRHLGATVEQISIPQHLDGMAVWSAIVSDGFWRTLKLNGLGYNYDGIYSQSYRKAMEGFFKNLEDAPVNAKLLLLLGNYLEKFNGYYYAAGKNLVHGLRAVYDRAFEQYDLLLMPTTIKKSSKNPPGSDAESIDIIMSQAFGNISNTCQFNTTGHPALSIPCGLRDGLPVGMMLAGGFYDEATIYRAAYHFEQSSPWQDS